MIMSKEKLNAFVDAVVSNVSDGVEIISIGVQISNGNAVCDIRLCPEEASKNCLADIKYIARTRIQNASYEFIMLKDERMTIPQTVRFVYGEHGIDTNEQSVINWMHRGLGTDKKIKLRRMVRSRVKYTRPSWIKKFLKELKDAKITLRRCNEPSHRH